MVYVLHLPRPSNHYIRSSLCAPAPTDPSPISLLRPQPRGFPAWGIPPNGGLIFEIEVLKIDGKGGDL